MKRMLSIVMVALMVSLVACSPKAPDGAEKPSTATGDATVDSLGDDVNGIANEQNDLGTDNLNDIDAGLSDVENL